MNPGSHPLDLLLDLLDGRLAGEARRSVDEHVLGCAACQHELAVLAAARRATAKVALPPLPSGLEARVLVALDEADHEVSAPSANAPSAGTEPTGPRAPLRTAGGPSQLQWLALAGIAAAIILAAVLWWRPATDLPAAAAAHVSAYNSRQLAMASEATAADTAQDYLAQRVAFPVRVFDLGMMGYTIAGASVLDLAGHRSAAWVYRGDAGSLLCEMFLGRLADLPAADETRVVNDITFHIYHRDGGTQVFWEEGDVLCVLASTLPSNDVVQLAIAKAMKP